MLLWCCGVVVLWCCGVLFLFCSCSVLFLYVVVFSCVPFFFKFFLSKKVCMGSARLLLTEDLTTAKEKSKIHVFCTKAIKRLNESDRQLPQVEFMCRLLKKGIGVHTGGLLPIVKEMVEILFGKGLVKILFATETFAMGVNMPTRCVVFNGTKKHDGVSFRDLEPGEYTQMSGRAGRRGLDTVGTVLVAAWGDKLPEVTELHKMLKGKAKKLSSQFRLTYTMILILLRVEDMTVEEMIKRSFTEFSTQSQLGSKNLPDLKKKLAKALKKLTKKEDSNMHECTLCGGNVESFVSVLNQEKEMNMKLCLTLGIGYDQGKSSVHEKHLFPQGRLLVVRCALPGGKTMLSNSPAVVVKTTSKSLTVVCLCPDTMLLPKDADVVEIGGNGDDEDNEDDEDDDAETKHERTAAAHISSFMPNTYRRLLNDGNVLLVMLTIPYTKIVRICSDQFNVSSVVAVPATKKSTAAGTRKPVLGSRKKLTTSSSSRSRSAFELAVYDNDNAVLAISKYLTKHGSSGGFGMKQLPLAYDLKELKLNDMAVVQLTEELETVRAFINTHPCHGCSRCTLARQPIERISLLKDKLTHIDRVLSNENLSLFPDFEKKCKILQFLEYTSVEDSVVQLKGRVACEVNTCDELLLTELIFENVLEPLTTEEAVALLSAFVFQQRGVDDAPELNAALLEAKHSLELIATNICAVQMKHGLELDPFEYVQERLNFGMMHVVYEWSRGVPFSSICELTAVEEGTIVRCITRLDETCREVRNIARIIGDPSLYHKMEEASNLIKRDIVFATSLYL